MVEKLLIPSLPSCADLRSGKITSVAFTKLCLDRIEARNPELNAFIALDPTALDQAAESDRRLQAGAPRSPIEGMPVGVKDNLLVAGLPATWGDELLRNHVPDHDELPIRTLRAAGAVIIGKTNTPPIAMMGITDNILFGPTRNPWDVSLTPGGSSGGSAAAVAAGLVPLALGTDGGGSTRRPAAHTGLWGLKPSIGRIARGDGFPAILGDLEVVGLFAPTLPDLSDFIRALARPDPRDPASRFLSPMTDALAAPSKLLRIAVMTQIENEPVDPYIRRKFEAAVERMRGLGHAIIPTQLPVPIAQFNEAFAAMGRAGMATVARLYPHFHDVSDASMRALAREGEAMDAASLMEVLENIARLRALAADWFSGFDVLLTPATAAQPWPIGLTHPPEIDGKSVGARGHAVFTSWVNVIGHPSLAIPLGLDEAGLPVGLQIVGDRGADERVLQIGTLFQTS